MTRERPPDATDEPPTFPERIGCFVFVALPLIFGIPVARAYSKLLGEWVLLLYVIVSLLLLALTVYTLEREEEPE